MSDLGTVLIVDDSRSLVALLRDIFRPLAREVWVASGVAQAREILRMEEDVSLVLCDVVLGDGDAFELLNFVSDSLVPAPAVVLFTSRPSEADAARAAALGAAGYLSKPLSPAEVVACLVQTPPEIRSGATRARRPAIGRMTVLDADSREAEISWEVVDLSESGALLESGCPIELGSQLEGILELYSASIPVRFEIVRTQPPTWIRGGGVGVRFLELSGDARRMIAEALLRLHAKAN